MSAKFNLEAYFDRIKYAGPRTATTDNLRALHSLHAEYIAFENLNPLLRIPVRLDPESLQQKLVHSRRGGYCFEQNLLFMGMLEAMGFKVRGLAARVLWNRPENSITPRGHMLLHIKLEEKSWIADVGFGGQTLTAPLLLKPGVEQETSHELYRLMQFDNGDYKLQTFVRDEWKTMYRFDLQEQYLPDYEVSNWYLSNNPASHFVTGLIAARPEPGRRYTLRNNELSVHHLKGSTERTVLTSVAELQEVLEEKFLLVLPNTDNLNKTLSRLTMSGEVVS